MPCFPGACHIHVYPYMDSNTDHFTPLALRVRGNYIKSLQLKIVNGQSQRIFRLNTSVDMIRVPNYVIQENLPIHISVINIYLWSAEKKRKEDLKLYRRRRNCNIQSLSVSRNGHVQLSWTKKCEC